MLSKNGWSRLAALCVCTMTAALSSCAAVTEQKAARASVAAQSEPAALCAVTVVDGDSLTLEGQTLSAEKADQSVLVVKNGGSVVLRGCTITKTGSAAEGGASAAEGVNAALVAQSGGSLVLENCTIETDGAGATALAAVGENACVVVSDTDITTRQEASAGIMAADNGCVMAESLRIETEGAYSPMLYAGAGSGTIQAGGIQGHSRGAYAPCVYAGGTLSLTDSEMVADVSACAVLEGQNRLSLAQTMLESRDGGMGVLVFRQDAAQADGRMAELRVSGGRVTADKGAALHITNTAAYVCITDSAQIQGASGVAVKAAAGRWGSSGSNGGQLVLHSDAAIEGAIVHDGLSSVQTVTEEQGETNAKTP